MFGSRMMTAVLALALVYGGVQSAQADGGTIKGVANWEGKIPKRTPIQVSADPHCAKVHADDPLLSDKLVISTDNKIRDVFVYVKSGLPVGKTWPVTAEPMVLNQKGCHYEPHVFGIMIGQDLLVKNSDNTAHNINAQPKNNAGFNKGQPKKGMEFTETFSSREMMFKIKCDVHPWMKAYCAVMEHPFFATTNEKGEFEISGLPDGEYVIATWHERFKKGQEQTVVISGGATTDVNFVFARPKKKKKG